MKEDSIFQRYYKEIKFVDRQELSDEESIDVIIPLINTNDLFERNLYSFYREIPINRLIIGNAGCTDNSIEIVNKFPRVEVIEQTSYVSLGYCIAELISLVETDWFVHLHADVYLPDKWYDNMAKSKNSYDFFECDRKISCIIEYNFLHLDKVERALSGSQMGRRKAFKNILPKIDDDYLYRNEDIIFHELILAEGFKYGKSFDTFHYHQKMKTGREMEPDYKIVKVINKRNREWEKKTQTMQIKGIIKYLQPKPYLIKGVNISLSMLKIYNDINLDEFKKWVEKTNINWLKYLNLTDLKPKSKLIQKIFNKIKKILNPVIMKLF